MESVVITVQAVTQPQPGKKRGRIQATNGQLFQADPSFLGQVALGRNYDVSFETQNFNGTNFRVVKGIVATAAPATTAPSYASASTGGGVGIPSGGRYGSTDLSTAERIFVCGALNAMLGNPNVTPVNMSQTEIMHLVTNLRGAWASTFGKPAGAPSPAPTPVGGIIDDEIPDFR